MKTLTNIPGLNQEDTVTIRKFGYGKKKQVQYAGLKLDIKQNKQTEVAGSFDIVEHQLALLKYGIVNASFIPQTMTKENYIENELDPEIGDWIAEQIREYNAIKDLGNLKKKLEQ